jgi:uncharacterized protein YcaQ
VGTRVTWEQVTAYRLLRHHLARRAPASALPSVVGDMGGAQAQLLGAAQMSIWARVRDVDPEHLSNAIWRDRILAKAGCMRRTLYLLPSKELAIFVRGSAQRAEKEIRWVLNRGISAPTLERLLECVLSALDQPLTRTELAERVSRKLELPLRSSRGGGWGSQRKVASVQVGKVRFPAYYLLHLAGARGVVCSGPNRGNEATFVRADAWLRDWADVPREKAEEELLRRYLRSFGPGNVEDFVAWTSMRLVDARAIWQREEEALEPVDVQGRPAWILRRDLSDLEGAEVERPTVRLLPYFDSFLLGHEERWHLLTPQNHPKVYRSQGWVAPVLLVDGRVQGTWSHHRKGEQLTVRINSFGPASRPVASAIREESQELGRFLGCEKVEVRLD